MSTDPCHRVRDALAARNVWGDGALLEHAKDCEVCTSELATLKKRRDFRDAFPVLSSIADEGATARPRANGEGERRGSRRHLLVMIATLVAIVGFLTRKSPSQGPSVPQQEDGPSATKPPRFKIYNLDNAVFESKVEGGTVRSTMSRGVASFHVERLNGEQRFLVTLPDGDLEVRGTTFVVTIEDGKTKHVEVSDGTVALHFAGRAEVLVTAGQRWPSSAGRPSVSFMSLSPRDAGASEPAK